MNKASSITKPRLFAHRGTSLLAPENTQAAFDLAVRYQCDVLETDVRLSKDGVVIVTHDETLERTTNGYGRVRDYQLHELKRFDAGANFRDLTGAPFNGPRQQLLTLDELFQLYPHVGINIDIKDNNPLAAAAVAKVITASQRNLNPTQWINVGSFHANVTHAFRREAPNISTAATRQEVARIVFGSTKRIIPNYQLLQIPMSYWGIALNGPRLINKVQQMGCEVVYWTINDAQKITQLLNKGCHGVVTDRPDLALAEFERAGIKGTAEPRN